MLALDLLTKIPPPATIVLDVTMPRVGAGRASEQVRARRVQRLPRDRRRERGRGPPGGGNLERSLWRDAALFAREHVLLGYGDEEHGVDPWSLVTEAHAREPVTTAQRAVDLARECLAALRGASSSRQA